MPKTHPPYASEYRRQMVELARAGRTPGELSREFECSAQATRNPVRQAGRDEGRLTTAEREDLHRFCRKTAHFSEPLTRLAGSRAKS